MLRILIYSVLWLLPIAPALAEDVFCSAQAKYRQDTGKMSLWNKTIADSKVHVAKYIAMTEAERLADPATVCKMYEASISGTKMYLDYGLLCKGSSRKADKYIRDYAQGLSMWRGTYHATNCDEILKRHG